MGLHALVAVREPALRDRLLRALEGAGASSTVGALDAERLPAATFELLFVDAPGPDAPTVARLVDRHPAPLVVVMASPGAPVVAGLGELGVVRIDPALEQPALAGAVAALLRAQPVATAELGGVGVAGAGARGVVAPTERFVSSSPAMVEVLDVLRRVASSESSVLLLGETGSGKERLASLIHQNSPRRGGPFVAINCAAIPAELFESELFGHRRGAFTGASRDHRGVFEQARGGTLFLDEVADLPLGLQAKLLRALQEHQVRPVGADRPVPTDTRVVSATNRDLRIEAEQGRFRPDLFYRLGVIEITVPPLRERVEDIWPLTQAWLEHFAGRLGRSPMALDPALRPLLERHPWPGNVRELVNVVERAVLLARGPTIGPQDLPAAVLAPPAPVDAAQGVMLPTVPVWMELELRLPAEVERRSWREVRTQVLSLAEKEYLQRVLHASAGRIAVAARAAGMTERALFEKMRHHGLRKEDFRGPLG